jgi:hypothetical protein
VTFQIASLQAPSSVAMYRSPSGPSTAGKQPQPVREDRSCKGHIAIPVEEHHPSLRVPSRTPSKPTPSPMEFRASTLPGRSSAVRRLDVDLCVYVSRLGRGPRSFLWRVDSTPRGHSKERQSVSCSQPILMPVPIQMSQRREAIAAAAARGSTLFSLFGAAARVALVWSSSA